MNSDLTSYLSYILPEKPCCTFLRTLCIDHPCLLVPVYEEAFSPPQAQPRYRLDENCAAVLHPGGHTYRTADSRNAGSPPGQVLFRIDRKVYDITCSRTDTPGIKLQFLPQNPQISSSLTILIGAGKPSKLSVSYLIQSPDHRHTKKSLNYSLENILHRNLLLLMPLYIQSYRSELPDIDLNPAMRRHVVLEYYTFRCRVCSLARQNRLSCYTASSLIELTEGYIAYVTAGYSNLRKELSDILADETADYQSKDLFLEGVKMKENKLLDALFPLVNEHKISLAIAADIADLPVDIFADKLERAHYHVPDRSLW